MDEDLEIIDCEETELEKMRKSANQNNEVQREDSELSPTEMNHKQKRNYKKIGNRLILLSFLLIPLFLYLYIISLHSTDLINESLSIVMLVLTIISVLILIAGITLSIVYRNQQVKKMKMWKKLSLGTFFTGYVTISTLVMMLLYGPNPGFRDWLVTTAMTTMSHKYFATWFYDDTTIKEVMSNHTVVESDTATNPDLIQISGVTSNDNVIYANEYEEEILKKDEGNESYKIIDIDRTNSKGKPIRGKMAVIYDPSKVKIATSKGMGTNVGTAYGQMVKKMASDNGAIIGMNASGFFDPGNMSNGGVPRGYVIKDGKIVANNKWGRSYGGLIGFDSNNRLILDKDMTAQEAIAAGIRDGVQYGPFLVVNGEPAYIKGNGGFGVQPRSVIAQRKDGIVLMLVIDGRNSSHSVGASMNDLVDILMDYGAYNAANLDGGTSSSLNLNGEIITKPVNGDIPPKPKTRIVPNAWIAFE